MNSVSPELTLEEILQMARQVKAWNKINTYSNETSELDGFYRINGGLSKVRIEVRKTEYSVTTSYYGYVYFKNEQVANLSGDDAKGIYEIAESKLNQKVIKILEKKERARLAAEERRERAKQIGEERRIRKVQELKEMIAPKPERLPWYRRLGK